MGKPKSRFSEGLTAASEYLSMACIALMAVLIVAQVVLRYVFNDPLTWSEEMSRITFIYLTFLGISAAYGRRRHMFVDSIIVILPAGIRKAAEFLVAGIATAFLLVTIVVTTRSMVELYRIEITTPALDYPMAFVYLVIPLGLAALVLQMWIYLLKERADK
jgi:TRAP-type C4-dicarboxylate transport system permease small subunit